MSQQLWQGEFGDEYNRRNSQLPDRSQFWKLITELIAPYCALEVGCGTGHNLSYLTCHERNGVDVNMDALSEAGKVIDNAYLASALELPFPDDHFDFVFCIGLLIHQSDEELEQAINEMFRVSSDYVLIGEYQGNETIPYHGEVIHKREYGDIVDKLWNVKLIRTGLLTEKDGFDDVTYWLFSKYHR